MCQNPHRFLCSDAVKIFQGTIIKITTEGQRHLGAVFRTMEYKHTHTYGKISHWIKELQTLRRIAWFEPQAAFSFLDPRPTEGPIKSPLSICLSLCQFGIFLRNESLFFSIFVHDDR